MDHVALLKKILREAVQLKGRSQTKEGGAEEQAGCAWTECIGFTRSMAVMVMKWLSVSIHELRMI